MYKAKRGGRGGFCICKEPGFVRAQGVPRSHP
jgi:hypothetical protein